MLMAGIAVTLAFHLVGSWDLMRFGGTWRSVSSTTLEYEIPCYDMRPSGHERGRVVIYPGFGACVQVYYPLASSLARSGYAVRLAGQSGYPNSGVEMAYRNHGVEALEAARPFLAEGPDVAHLLAGHSEGTRYALEVGSEVQSVDGVALLASVSSALTTTRPPNVLMLVAENDMATVKRQTSHALMNGTKLARPKFDTTYGDIGVGTARKARIMPGTNHFNLILDGPSHREVLDWFNEISGNRGEGAIIDSRVRLPVLAAGALLGACLAVTGIGLLFPKAKSDAPGKAFPAWALLAALIAGWGVAALVANSLPLVQEIPLLVYARVLAFLAFATVPLAVLAAVAPMRGAGVPRGPWKARAAVLGVSLTLLLFDRWLVSVIPMGKRLLWFGMGAVVSGCYFACEEFLRRGVQRATDWQTGFALGLAGSLIAALSVAGAAFFIGSPVGEFLIAGAMTLCVLLVACEMPATYLFATTGDWLLSWWIRIAVFNGFLVGLVPLVSESEFRRMLP